MPSRDREKKNTKKSQKPTKKQRDEVRVHNLFMQGVIQIFTNFTYFK